MAHAINHVIYSYFDLQLQDTLVGCTAQIDVCILGTFKFPTAICR